MDRAWIAIVAAGLAGSLGFVAAPAVAQALTGRQIAQRDCGACHAVTVSDASRDPAAPPFRTLGARYDVGDLAEALAEGISVGHPKMPVFSYPPDQVQRLIAYLRRLQPIRPHVTPGPGKSQ
jgi:cytochrome c